MTEPGTRPVTRATPPGKVVSVVVPVYDGAVTIPELVERLGVVLSRISAGFEIILVNDGSRDESWAVIRRLAQDHRGVIGLNLFRNYGQQNAAIAGVEAAQGDIIVTIDDDLDYYPEDIPLLLDALEHEHDLAYGVHPNASGGWVRRLAAAVARATVRRVSPHGLTASSFRAFDGAARRAFARAQTPHASLDVLLTWALVRPTSVALPERPRLAETRYRWRALISLFATAIAGLSVRPLQLATWVGLLLTGSGAASLVVTSLTAPDSVSALVLSGVMFLTGVQCLLVGILGVYLGRIYFLSLGLPSPIVRERVGERARLETTAVR